MNDSGIYSEYCIIHQYVTLKMLAHTHTHTHTPVISCVLEQYTVCGGALWVMSHGSVHGTVGAQRSVFRREGLASRTDDGGIPPTRPLLTDVLQWRSAAQRCVVRTTHGQEVRRLISGHHLTRIGEDGGDKEAKGVNT